jgi:lipopolysaccharide biosynthesis glycosyltransferase
LAEKIHIALTFDDGFWAPAYATMRSICLSSRRPRDVVFHLIHTGLASEHRQALSAIETEFGATLDHIALDEHAAYRALVADLPMAPPFTPIIYARLLIDKLLPGVTRVVYLDCDMMVRAPIEALGEIDLGGKPIAAVLDANRHYHMLGRDLIANTDIFDFHFAYFNSGLLVIDTAAFGAANLPERTKAYFADGSLKRLQYDQAVLNRVFKDNWLALGALWNLTNPEPAHEYLDPSLVHYTGPNKPWSLFRAVAFAREYRHTMTNAVFYAFLRERWVKRLTAPFRKLLGQS